VIGGLGSVMGAVLGAIWVIGLPALFGDSPQVSLATSGIGLLVLLMYFPGGLIELVHRLRDAIRRRLMRSGEPAATAERPVRITRPPITRPAAPDRPALEAAGVSVRFGASIAVDNMSITLQRGEIVGLIGANGAGKTTFMNAIGGYVPSTGSVHLFGEELTGRSPADRARRGLGRAFQNAELYGDLTVRETLQVALEARHRTSVMATILGTRGGMRRERLQRAEADELLAFLGLGRYANVVVGNLSTGTRRITELACLLALDSAVVCLDEPTAGVAQRETEAFGPLIKELRREFELSMIVIEHDMPLVMAISDRVYCMANGSKIAEGSPEQVRNDPSVIASYLGTDERAIARSTQ
jgi:ABC-type branched-subunit amino acid transport system ATPase component